MPSPSEQRRLEKIRDQRNALMREASKRSLRFYLENVVIDCQPEPKTFVEVADPWQWDKILNPLIPAIEILEGIRPGPLPYDGYWYTLPKGSDKTSMLGRVFSHCVQFSKKEIRIAHGATDRDQASELRKSMETEQKLNSWFLPAPQYEVQKNAIFGPTGQIDILTSDAESSHGSRCHIYSADEITVWKNKSLWDMMQTSAGKYEDTLILVICNAGYSDTWQNELWHKVEQDPRWYKWEAPGIVASWQNLEKIASLREKITATEGIRLFDNIWVDSRMASIFTPESINAMVEDYKPEFMLPDFAEWKLSA